MTTKTTTGGAQKPSKPSKKINSRDKGANGERELAKAIHEHLGVRLERKLEQTRNGGFDLEPVGDSPAANALRNYAIECKRHATATACDIRDWWLQAVRQADTGRKTPALAYRMDRQDWRVVVPVHAINPEMSRSHDYPMTATLSLDAFAMLVREAA